MPLSRPHGRTGHGHTFLLAYGGFIDLDRQVAPVYVAFKAYVQNEKLLLDANPEVRGAAQTIYDRLNAPRRNALKVVPKAQSGRGRAPRRKAK